MSRLWWMAVLTVTASPLAAPAQEYSIKVGKPGPGDQFQVKADNKTEIEFKLLDAGGNAVMEKTENKGHHGRHHPHAQFDDVFCLIAQVVLG